MKLIKQIGLVVFLVGLGIFTASLFLGGFEITEEVLTNNLSEQEMTNIGDQLRAEVIGKTYNNAFSASNALTGIYDAANEEFKKNEQWDNIMWTSSSDFALKIVKPSGVGFFAESPMLYFLLTFGLGILGALMYILPNVVLLGSAGIKNDGIYQEAATNRGWIGYTTFVWLVGFYVLLYFYPQYIVNWIYPVDALSMSLSGNPASQWFLYGFLYCTVMVVMGIRMYIKYRHNRYQMIRTTSVLFFQIAFAFLIPEILVRFNMPYMDFKNAWPLDYDFFFDWNVNSLIGSGKIGLFMLFWGIALTIVIVPVMVYIYGKRWYCSWVCGCGGLAETLGDPYRQLSSKTVNSWKLERILIHAVLLFAVVMTAATIYAFLQNNPEGYWITTGGFIIILSFLLLGAAGIFFVSRGDFKTLGKNVKIIVGIATLAVLGTAVLGYFMGDSQIYFVDNYSLQKSYGFLIGAVFAGVIGTGFYPVLGNRAWCRFGCPLAAYMGLIQRLKSRFRITTNGGQCISCGNCSTYCEMGIDVRWYAQRGQNIIRSSCVGCGICSAVCPRGVLKLENGPEEGRINDNPILIGNDGITLNPTVAAETANSDEKRA